VEVAESDSHVDVDLADLGNPVPPPDSYDPTGIPSEEGPFEPPTPRPASDAERSAKAIDKEVRKARLEEKPPKDKAKAGPPTLAEWQDFFARIVFLTIAEWYVSWCFRGVAEDVIDDEDLAKLTLSKEDRAQIAAPFAELANKSSIARKHGRQLIAFADSIEAMVIVGMWVSKVNRTARKYKPQKEKRARMGQAAPPANGAGPGYIPDENVRVYNPGTG
jgi:hypothetical protein